MYTVEIVFVCEWHQKLLFLGPPSETPWKPLGNPFHRQRKPLANADADLSRSLLNIVRFGVYRPKPLFS